MSTRLATFLPPNLDRLAKRPTPAESKTTNLSKEELHDEEVSVRKNASHNVGYLVVVNLWSAVIVFVFHLISLETLMSIAISIALTVHIYNITDDNANFDGSVMNWTMLSFAVVTPISAAVTMAFSRRETALTCIANIRSTLLEIYVAHAVWDWGQKPGEEDSGRKRSNVDWQKHADSTFNQILGICHDLTRWLTLPNCTRARHKTTPRGRKEAEATLALGSGIYEAMMRRFGHLADLCEILKREGLPPNEATRIRQWERMVLESIEKLRMIKMYRTPQGLRSFGRLFSIFLPPFYAPYYAELARNLDSLGMAITYAVFTSIALTSLFETISQMEDPFIDMSILDGVHVQEDLIRDFPPKVLALRKHFFPDATEFKHLSNHSGAIPDVLSSSTTRFLNE